MAKITKEMQAIIDKAVAQAIAEYVDATEGATKKGTSTKGKAKNSTSKKVKSNASTKKATSVKTELEPLTLVCDEDAKTVKFSRFVRNYGVFNYVDLKVSECGGTYSKADKCWSFSTKKAYKTFTKAMEGIDVSALTDEQFEEANAHIETKKSAKSTYTDEEKTAYKDAYNKEWAKYVDDCKKKGIKRTKEMNRAKSAEIRQSLKNA